MCAWELIKTIRLQKKGSGRIFINTNGISRFALLGVKLFKDFMAHKQLPPDWLYFKGEKVTVKLEEVKDVLKKAAKEELENIQIYRNIPLLYLIENNVLFFNPDNGNVKFQGRIIEKAVAEIVTTW